MDDVLRVSTEVLVNHRNVIRREKVEGAVTLVPRRLCLELDIK